MSYLHIDNLDRNDRILQFKEVYCLEKIHGTSAHVSWKQEQLHLSPGGCKMVTFESLFARADLINRLNDLGHDSVVLFGEQHGGKQQGMSDTYGKEARFTVFDVKIGPTWLNVPNAESVTNKLGLEFVHYRRVPCTQEALAQERGADSVQAIRNGMGAGKAREGIVVRPLQEFRDNRGERVMAKYKRDAFCETRTPRRVGDPVKQLEGEQAAFEWVTDMRVRHVVDKLVATSLVAKTRTLGIEHTGPVIKALLADIEREGGGEVVMNRWTRRAISAAASKTYQQLLPGLRKQYSDTVLD